MKAGNGTIQTKQPEDAGRDSALDRQKMTDLLKFLHLDPSRPEDKALETKIREYIARFMWT